MIPEDRVGAAAEAVNLFCRSAPACTHQPSPILTYSYCYSTYGEPAHVLPSVCAGRVPEA